MIRSVEIERADRTMLVVAAAVAVTIGVLAAATSPLVPLGAIVGFLLVGLIWWRPIFGVYLFVAVIALLPFGVIPIPLAGAQLTFVDAIMIATFAAMVARWVFTSDRVRLDTPAIALVLFVLVSIAAFVVGSGVSPITPELVRRTGKLLASLLFFLVARDLLNTSARLASITRALILAGAVQGAIAAALMALSPLAQLTVLTRLQVIGYPSDSVLRYVPGPNNTYTEQLRAIGTSVDPNVLGGTLMLALVLIVVQWASPRPVLRKGVLFVLALPTAAGVLLSLSRASWAGLAVGLTFIGVVRYRRILVLGVFAGAALLVTPLRADVHRALPGWLFHVRPSHRISVWRVHQRADVARSISAAGHRLWRIARYRRDRGRLQRVPARRRADGLARPQRVPGRPDRRVGHRRARTAPDGGRATSGHPRRVSCRTHGRASDGFSRPLFREPGLPTRGRAVLAVRGSVGRGEPAGAHRSDYLL